MSTVGYSFAYCTLNIACHIIAYYILHICILHVRIFASTDSITHLISLTEFAYLIEMYLISLPFHASNYLTLINLFNIVVTTLLDATQVDDPYRYVTCHISRSRDIPITFVK